MKRDDNWTLLTFKGFKHYRPTYCIVDESVQNGCWKKRVNSYFFSIILYLHRHPSLYCFIPMMQFVFVMFCFACMINWRHKSIYCCRWWMFKKHDFKSIANTNRKWQLKIRSFTLILYICLSQHVRYEKIKDHDMLKELSISSNSNLTPKKFRDCSPCTIKHFDG